MLAEWTSEILSLSLSLSSGTGFARQAIPRRLRCCTLCNIQALGDESQLFFVCPQYAHVRQFRSLYQGADGTMQCFVAQGPAGCLLLPSSHSGLGY